VASKERNTVRFAVGSASEARSSLWRLWVDKDDVYLAVRQTPRGLKVSLHKSGDWRIAWVKNPDLNEQLHADRIVCRWRRPPEFTPGWTHGVSILVPAIPLQHPLSAMVEAGTKVAWIPPAQPGRALEIGVLISAPRARITTVRVADGPARTVGQVKLANGDAVWVVMGERLLTPVEQAATEKMRTTTINMTGEPKDPCASAIQAETAAILDVALGLENFAWPGKDTDNPR
jgi:hypothetical protein